MPAAHILRHHNIKDFASRAGEDRDTKAGKPVRFAWNAGSSHGQRQLSQTTAVDSPKRKSDSDGSFYSGIELARDLLH